MSKLKEEDIRFNIIINGDAGRKAIVDLEKTVRDSKVQLEGLLAQKKKLEQQGKTETPSYKKLTSEIEKQSIAIAGQREKLQNLIRMQGLENMSLKELNRHLKLTKNAWSAAEPNTAKWKQLSAEIKNVDARITHLKSNAASSGNAISRMSSGISKYFGAITAGIASFSFLILGANKARDAFYEYDESLNDARRKTNMTRDEIELLSADLLKINTRTARTELLDMARVGGKLGVAKKDVEGFVKAANTLKVAIGKDLGENTEESINQIGKLVEIFKLKDKFGMEQALLKTGSAVLSLGKATTANEANIVEFMKRTAGVGPTSNMSIQNIAAVGATLDALGQTMEVSGTVFSQVMTGMYSKTAKYAQVAKMSVADFKKLRDTDINGALIKVLEGMQGDKGGLETIVKALGNLKLQGKKGVEILGALANNTELLRLQQEISNDAFESGTSILNEYNIMNNSALAKKEKFKNAIIAESVELGENLVPAYAAVASVTLRFMKILSGTVGWLVRSKGIIIPLAAALAAYTVIVKLHAGWVTISTTATKLWTASHILFSKAIAFATSATSIFNAVMKIGPWGWFAAVIGTAAGVITFFTMRTTEAIKAQKMWADVNKSSATAVDENGRCYATTAHSVERLWKKTNDLNLSEAERTSALKELQKLMPNGIKLINDETIANGKAAKAVAEYSQQLLLNAQIQAARDKIAELSAQEVQDHATGKDRKPSFMQKMWIQTKSAIMPSGPIQSLFSTKELAKASAQNLKEYKETVDKQISALESYIVTKQADISNLILIPSEKVEGDDDDGGDPNPLGNAKEEKWSLDRDKAFMDAKIKLKQQYQNGEIASEIEFNDKLRTLEIAAIEERIATKKESGDDLLKLQDQLSDKHLEQKKADQAKEEEFFKLSQQAETDKIKKENDSYARQQKKLAGNASALEALEKAHLRNITKIRLDEIDDRIKREEEQYDLAKKILKNRHQQELVDFTGNYSARKRLKQEQAAEEARLDESHLKDLASRLQTLINSGMFDDVKINMDLLSDEEKAALLNKIADITAAYLGLKTTINDPKYSFEGKNKDILGFSEEDWNLFFDRIKQGEFALEDLYVVIASLSEVTNMAMDVYSSYDKMVTSKENEEFKKYKKNQEKKKKANQSMVDAGLMTQEQAKAEEERMQAEMDAKQEELQIKQAKRQKAINISGAIMNTAKGITKALADWGFPLGAVFATIIGAIGAAQIAMIASTPISTGAEDGGYVVERRQDGKKYNARFDPNKRGYISDPTVLVSENGQEYVIPAAAVNNPSMAPVLSSIETARRKGTLGSFDFNAVYYNHRGNGVVGYESGGITGGSHTSNATTQKDTENDNTIRMLHDAVVKLLRKLDDPIFTYITLLGKNGLIEMMEKYKQNRNHGKLG